MLSERVFERGFLALRGVVASAAPESDRVLEIPRVEIRALPHPLALLDDAALRLALRREPAELGSAALGAPNRGRLLNAVRLLDGPGWEVVDGARSWGTEETIGYLEAALRGFRARFPGAPLVFVGDMSRRQGGWLRPHRSHQNGRDVDLGYLYRGGPAWYRPATRETLELRQTWGLLLSVLSEGDVEYVFIDGGVQALLREQAEREGYDPRWLDRLFGGFERKTDAVVRHARGHRTHMHVRYFAPNSSETGRRVKRLL